MAKRLTLSRIRARHCIYWCLLTFSSCQTYARELFLALDSDTSYISIPEDSRFMTRAKLDIGVERDFESLFGGHSHAVVSYSLFRGKNASDFVQDVQSFSNIDEARYSKWYEAYFGAELPYEFSYRIGLMDATNDFIAPTYGDSFINASMGFSPTILGLSTFPTPKLGLFVTKKMPQWTLKIASYSDAEDRLSFSDSFQILEVEIPYGTESSIRLGTWHHTGLETRAGDVRSTSDFYAVLDHAISASLNGFVQFGNANTHFNEIKTHWSIGLNYKGLFYEDDFSGAMVSKVDVYGASSETAIELYTNITISDNVGLKPGLIYIHNIAGDGALGNATIVNLRLSISF
ncbi:carbohydrate porin [Pseudoalteromonas xiamenensis]